ncbi:hypothetical protein [Pantoea cypripedii]|uniref:Uncharacterized protein n=1 Tax=Pantoea cypripedii TaxID=55209 RepID=A0A1X1EYD5_PANCY|nr:hypothetical protein [Pantoea cypripedii]MBP2195144.1 Fe2+ or Zn2+ uptake regulation protein [Pantoea cypripedii]ORM94981.1 hypothetical protein HA50_17180 [Pantoea cypripedii]
MALAPNRVTITSVPPQATFSAAPQKPLAAKITSVKQSHQRPTLHRSRKKKSPKPANRCLTALQAEFAAWWDKVPKTGSMVAQVEMLLLLFPPPDIEGFTIKQLHTILRSNQVNIGMSTVENALTTARTPVPATKQALIKTLWQQPPLQSDACARVQRLLPLELSPSQLRRALWNIGEDVDITLINQAQLALKEQAMAQETAWIAANLHHISDYDSVMAMLVRLQELPGYQHKTPIILRNALKNAGIPASIQTVRQARALFNTQPSQRQKDWFAANWPEVCKLMNTRGQWLEMLLNRPGRPPMTTPELWRLLHDAHVNVGISMVRKALMLVIAQPTAQRERVAQHWQQIGTEGRITLVKRLWLLLCQLDNSDITWTQIHLALKEAGEEVSDATMDHALAAFRTQIKADELAWIRAVHHRIPEQETERNKIIALLRHEGCPKPITASKLLRLLWTVGRDVSVGTILTALRIVRQQPEADIPDDDNRIVEMVLDMEEQRPASP